jgi:phage shock protein PspC (stress-responsive transcriptional regulator)
VLDRGELTVRVMFVLLLGFALVGLAYFIALGLLDR